MIPKRMYAVEFEGAITFGASMKEAMKNAGLKSGDRFMKRTFEGGDLDAFECRGEGRAKEIS